jgi:hypothetical protein
VAELAAALGVEIKRLHYHVTALVRLRLLTVVRTRRRAGRAVKLYRASAAAFFIPDEIAAEIPSAPLMRQMQESLAAARRTQDEGVLYDVSENGKPRMRSIAQSSKRNFAAAETWRILTLSTEDARHLSDEMRALLEKYASRNGDSWLAHFALCSNPGGKKGRSKRTARV